MINDARNHERENLKSGNIKNHTKFMNIIFNVIYFKHVNI
jgi:hypothetical protein